MKCFINNANKAHAIIERTDSRVGVHELKKHSIRYDMIFFDIPYDLIGQKGGNRKLVDYNVITPTEFEGILIEAEKLLRTRHSSVYFMIAGGKSSVKGSQKYIDMFEHTGLKLVNSGTYTKLTKGGKVCNMGRYDMPPEIILEYTQSGESRFNNHDSLEFRLQRPPLPKSGGYRTQKPKSLLTQLIKRSTKEGEWVLDLFSENAIVTHILPKIKKHN